MKTFKCLKCGSLFAKEKRSLIVGDTISDSNIEFPQGHVAGDSLICRSCGHGVGQDLSKLENWFK